MSGTWAFWATIIISYTSTSFLILSKFFFDNFWNVSVAFLTILTRICAMFFFGGSYGSNFLSFRRTITSTEFSLDYSMC